MEFCQHRPRMKHEKKIPVHCQNCENLLACVKETNTPFREWKEVFHKVNKFHDIIQVTEYKEPIKILSACHNLPQLDKSRKFYMFNKNTIRAKNEEKTTLSDLMRCLDVSFKRSLDNFYGYALSNIWDGFFTFTIDEKKINRYDDFAVKYAFSTFQKNIKRTCPDIKLLAIAERHQPKPEHLIGALHFHGLIANCKDMKLSMAKNPKNGKYLKTVFGHHLYNSALWTYGFSTIALIPHDDNQLQVVNYCAKYLTKNDSNLGYNKKRYYRSKNLEFKEVSYDFKEILMDGNVGEFSVYKETDKLSILRAKLQRMKEEQNK